MYSIVYIVYCLTWLSAFHIYLNWKAYKDEWDLTKVVAYHQFDILNMLLLIWVHLLRHINIEVYPNDCFILLNCCCQNVSTMPLRQWVFWQCLSFSWSTLRGIHCQHSIGVVDAFGPCNCNDQEKCLANLSTQAVRCAPPTKTELAMDKCFSVLNKHRQLSSEFPDHVSFNIHHSSTI